MKKILVADDDLTTRKMIAKSLENQGYTVVLASSGSRALSLTQDNPDLKLLITDMQMPAMDGRELINLAKADKTIPTLPIIIISGIISLREISDLLENGTDRFLPKPLNMDDLSKYVRELAK